MPPQEQAELWMALRDRMKADWHELTLQEKKAGMLLRLPLRRAARKRHFPMDCPLNELLLHFVLGGFLLPEEPCDGICMCMDRRGWLTGLVDSVLDRLRPTRPARPPTPRRAPRRRALHAIRRGRRAGHRPDRAAVCSRAAADYDQGLSGAVE